MGRFVVGRFTIIEERRGEENEERLNEKPIANSLFIHFGKQFDWLSSQFLKLLEEASLQVQESDMQIGRY